jgi:hypothetical protein
MADSSLVTYEDYSPHFGYPQGSHGRSSGVGCICVHHMAGNLSVETCGRVFHNCETSANYGISSDGKVGQYVREADAPWAAGNKACNNFAIHIEVANDGGASSNWHVSDTAIAKCIDLIVDICKRKGWTQFRFSGDDQNGELIAHKWYASTACPGPYLYSKFPYIASEVQKRLSGTEEKLYRVRKSWADSKTQAGAYKKLENAKKKADEKKSEGYKVFDWDGNVVYTPSTVKEVYRVRKSWDDSKSQIGAYKKLENAIASADKRKSEGYKVFDWNGECVYTPAVTQEETKVEPKEESKSETKVEPKKEETQKTDTKTEGILARLFKKYGKGAGR